MEIKYSADQALTKSVWRHKIAVVYARRKTSQLEEHFLALSSKIALQREQQGFATSKGRRQDTYPIRDSNSLTIP